MEIFLINTEDLAWKDAERFCEALSAPRRRAVEKKKNDGDRINALVSRLFILSEIEKRTGVPVNKISFGKTSQGKPFLKDGLLFFSLSHTGGAVCAAFSEDGEIGIDVERRARKVTPEMYKRVLSEEERAAAKSDEDFLRFWVQKEAFLKRLGIGISRDLRGVSTPLLPDTLAIDAGNFFVGASGKGAAQAVVEELSAFEVFERF